MITQEKVDANLNAIRCFELLNGTRYVFLTHVFIFRIIQIKLVQAKFEF